MTTNLIEMSKMSSKMFPFYLGISLEIGDRFNSALPMLRRDSKIPNDPFRLPNKFL